MTQCRRNLSISETVLETLHLVTTSHINPLGTLHGGVALRWMITTASMAAMRVARGPALIAHLDNVFFLNPIRLGENAVVTSWVEYIGRTSMEITTLVEAEDPVTGERTLTTASHMTYVAVDESLRPRPVNACITPRTPLEEELQARAIERRRTRERKGSIHDTDPPRPLLPGYTATTHKLVNPEDTMAYNAMHGGRLLYIMDELSGILGMKYAKGPVVTAAVDATDFLTPIIVGDILQLHAAITYIGKTSMEITVKAIKHTPIQTDKLHAATSHFTMVHLGTTGKPTPIPPFQPTEQWQEELYKKARERKEKRTKLLQFFKNEIKRIKPPKSHATQQ